MSIDSNLMLNTQDKSFYTLATVMTFELTDEALNYKGILDLFIACIKSHDYRYEESDDHRKYMIGKWEEDQLFAAMKRWPALQEVYKAYIEAKEAQRK